MKRSRMLLITALLTAAVAAGCGQKTESTVTESSQAESAETESSQAESTETESAVAESSQTEITLFAAKSLNTVMEEVIAAFNNNYPDVTITASYDSSGTLMTQIEEGATCDVFFSAATKQMDELETKGFLTEGTRHDIVNNQVCVVTWQGSGTEVTGLADIGNASSIALADGSVPVGKYTREAMIKAGILDETEDASAVTTGEISEKLGGVEINECANVGAVTAAVSEGSNEVGTVYYSDTYGLEDKLQILETIPYELTGNVIYPAAQINNAEADEAESAAAAEFVEFLTSDEAGEIFTKYYFDFIANTVWD